MLPGERRRIAVPRARWQAALGDRWPDDLALDGHLGRSDVFDVARAWRSGQRSTVDVVVASMAWGYGPIGYGPRRTSAILAADPALTRLDAALRPLRADQLDVGSLVSAYASLMRGRTNWVRGLGPAFVTKLLYFAGYRRGSDQVQPLILDSVVARRLPAEAGTASNRTGGWGSEQWLDYLRWAHRRADGGEPDGVEMALFAP